MEVNYVMSRDSVKNKEKPKKDINWAVFIDHTEAEILACRQKIKAMNKSLRFFRKQVDSGVPFPLPDGSRHKEIS
jgi:hypothetical protein